MKESFVQLKKDFDSLAAKLGLLLWIIIHLARSQLMHIKDPMSIKVLTFKILHLIFLYFIIHTLHKIYKNRKVPSVKHGIIIGIIYLSITTLLLIFIWPGTWSWDDVWTFQQANVYQLYAWQHFLSSVVHIIFLQTIPFGAGVIIMQLFVSALIVGYCVSTVADHYASSAKMKIFSEALLFIPNVMPPILMYIYSGFRMGLYSYFELLLISYINIHYHHSEKPVNVKILLNYKAKYFS